MKVKQNLKHSEAVAAGAPPESGVVRLIWDFFWGGSVLLAGLDGNFCTEQVPVVVRAPAGLGALAAYGGMANKASRAALSSSQALGEGQV